MSVTATSNGASLISGWRSARPCGYSCTPGPRRPTAARGRSSASEHGAGPARISIAKGLRGPAEIRVEATWALGLRMPSRIDCSRSSGTGVGGSSIVAPTRAAIDVILSTFTSHSLTGRPAVLIDDAAEDPDHGLLVARVLDLAILAGNLQPCVLLDADATFPQRLLERLANPRRGVGRQSGRGSELVQGDRRLALGVEELLDPTGELVHRAVQVVRTGGVGDGRGDATLASRTPRTMAIQRADGPDVSRTANGTMVGSSRGSGQIGSRDGDFPSFSRLTPTPDRDNIREPAMRTVPVS